MTRKLYSLILAASLFLTSVALLPGCSKTDSDEPESGQPSTPTNPNPETPSEKPSIDLTKIDCSGINFTSNVSPYLENGDTYESILEGLKIQIEDPTISVKNVGLRLKGASDFIMTTQLADKMIFSFTLQDLPHGKNELEFVLNLKQDGHKDTEKVFLQKRHLCV